jgi:general stress protein YciG
MPNKNEDPEAFDADPQEVDLDLDAKHETMSDEETNTEEEKTEKKDNPKPKGNRGKENNPGNFANNPKRAQEAGRKGGRR